MVSFPHSGEKKLKGSSSIIKIKKEPLFKLFV